jgi:hypothetical protein
MVDRVHRHAVDQDHAGSATNVSYNAHDLVAARICSKTCYRVLLSGNQPNCKAVNT